MAKKRSKFGFGGILDDDSSEETLKSQDTNKEREEKADVDSGDSDKESALPVIQSPGNALVNEDVATSKEDQNDEPKVEHSIKDVVDKNEIPTESSTVKGNITPKKVGRPKKVAVEEVIEDTKTSKTFAIHNSTYEIIREMSFFTKSTMSDIVEQAILKEYKKFKNS